MGPLHTLGLRGQGVTVAVVDDALELRHPDLVANVVPGGSKNFVDGSNDPTPRNGASHGTMVGGIMAAVGWNGLGGRGVAPDARLKGFNILSSEESPTDFDTNLRASWGDSVQSRDVDVFNNSFGSDLTYYPTISPAAERSLDRLMRRARNGKGVCMSRQQGTRSIVLRFSTTRGTGWSDALCWPAPWESLAPRRLPIR